MATIPPEDLNTDPQTPDLVTPSGGGRHMLFVGVVGACALGVGAGLWARPQAEERRVAPVAARMVGETPKLSRTLEIVVEDAPLSPIGAPIEVLPAMTGRTAPAVMLPTEPPPLSPLSPPAGLVRVQSVEPIEIEPAPAPPASAKKAEPRQAAKTEVDVANKSGPRPEKTRAAKPKASDRKLAKAEAPKPKAVGKPAKVAKAAMAEPKKVRKPAVALAKATPKPGKPAASASKAKVADDRKTRAEKKKARVERASLAAPKPKAPVKAAAKTPTRVEMTKAAKAKAAKAKVEKAALRKPAAASEAMPKVAPKPVLPKPTRDNPIRKASNRCVSADAGAALVCADASLSAADRQLARAYRQAEAAGVSTTKLARQQARWLAARAQAARDAPWAVRDVYEARIAELNDMTRDAREF